MASKLVELKRFSRKECCILCKGTETDELFYGTVYRLGKIVVHYFCLLLSSNVAQQGEDEEGVLGFLPDDIQTAAKDFSTKPCTICHCEGANIQCATARCRAMFHYPCGIKKETSHQFCGKFSSFCPKHRIRQKIPKKILDEINAVQLECMICFENVQLDNNIIWAPCCQKNAFFHRRCLQKMAFSFGSYTLKCPLCNNKNKFSAALEKNGVFIPQKDASWETEPQAFSELLARYSHCDALKCICPDGRDYSSNSTSSKWKIILCTDCGSQGVHKKCINAKTYRSCWKCDVCRNTEAALCEQPASCSIRTDSASAIEKDNICTDVDSNANSESEDVIVDSDVDVRGESHQNDSPESASHTAAATTIDNNYQQQQTASSDNVTIRRKRARSSYQCDESVHEEKIFVCVSDVRNTVGQELKTIETSTSKVEEEWSSQSLEDPLSTESRQTKPFELSPIIIIDSDDDKEKTDSVICIDSDESDDDLLEIIPASTNPEIEITVVNCSGEVVSQTPVPKEELSCWQRNIINLQKCAEKAKSDNSDGLVIGHIGNSQLRFISSQSKPTTESSMK